MRSLELPATVVAGLSGIGVAIAATRFISAPLLQTITAAVIGWLLGSVIGAVLWLSRSVPEAGVGAVAWNFRQVLVGIVVVALAAVAVHAAFGVLNVIHPALGSWRYLIVGAAASLGGCMGYPTGVGLGEPLR